VNAQLQWEDGERRLESARLERERYELLRQAAEVVQDELRRRLGSRFSLTELAEVYAEQADRLVEIAQAKLGDPALFGWATAAVDSACLRWSRGAADR
jgi:hypothetical protein